jgi:hypothetical protein
MKREVKIYLEEADYQRYLEQARFEKRTLSNFADYSMKRRCDQNTPQRKKTGQNQDFENGQSRVPVTGI